MNKEQKAAYASVRARRRGRLERPCRIQHVLHQAIDRAGLRVVGYYHEVQVPDVDYPLFFNAAVQIGNLVGYIDVNRDQRVPRRKRIREIKREYCQSNDIPYLELQPNDMKGVDNVRLQIERWRLQWLRKAPTPTI